MGDPITLPAGVTSLTLVINITPPPADPRLDRILALVQSLSDTEANVAMDLTALQNAVANETTVEQSAITLLEQLAADLKTSASDPTAVNAIADQINANATALADAVTANTPTAPAPPPA